MPLALRRPFADDSVTRALLFVLPGLLYLAPLAAAGALPIITAAILWRAHEEGVLAVRSALAEGWMWFGLLIVMAASALWAPDAGAALGLAARIACLILSGNLLTGTLRRLAPAVLEGVFTALAWGMLAAALLVAFDLFLGVPASRLIHDATRPVPPADAYSRGAAFQSIAAVPLALALWRAGRRRLAAAQLAAVGFAIMLGTQETAKLALVCGVLGGAAVLAVPAVRWFVPPAIVGLALVLPWVLPILPSKDATCWLAEHKASGLHRVMIWNWVDVRIRERPWLGWGLDASRRMPGGTERVIIRGCDDPPERLPRLNNEALPLHPHNAVLQVWLELGALGIVAALAAISGSCLGVFRRRSGRDAAPLVAMLASSAGVGLLSFGIWQEWWVAVLCLTAAIATTATMNLRPPGR